MKYGMGFILKPKSIDAMVTISNLGQRQAILHDVSVALGIYRDSGTPALVPLAKRDLEDGRVGIFVPPQDQDAEKAIGVIGNVPTLESAVHMSSEAQKEGEIRDDVRKCYSGSYNNDSRKFAWCSFIRLRIDGGTRICCK